MSPKEVDLPLMGVYHAVDTSAYSEIYPDDPQPQIKEISELYTNLIQLFVDMRYLNSENVNLAPHRNPRLNTTYPAKYGFTKDVVDFYQMIPYVTRHQTNWNYGSDAGEFIMGRGASS